jgi:hypothetical protein
MQMNKYIRGLLLVFTLGLSSVCSVAQISYGSRASALNHAVTALDNHDWSIYGNPATVSESNKQFSFYYVRYYGISELADIALSASYPIKWGVLSTGIHTYGFDLYRETNLSLAWMYKYERIKSAIKIHYDHIAFPSPYGSAGSIGFDIGVLFQLADVFDVGATAINLNRPQIGLNNEDRPRLMTIGFAYKPLDKGIILFDLVKDVRFPISVRSAIEYSLLDVLILRAGVGNEPINTTFGAGFALKKIKINLAVERHQDLGWSPGIDIGFNW